MRPESSLTTSEASATSASASPESSARQNRGARAPSASRSATKRGGTGAAASAMSRQPRPSRRLAQLDPALEGPLLRLPAAGGIQADERAACRPSPRLGAVRAPRAASSSRACGARTGAKAPETERLGRVEIARERRPRRVPVEARPRAGHEETRQEQGPAVPLQVEDGGDGASPERGRGPEDASPFGKRPLARLEREDAVDVAMRLEERLRPHVGHDVEAQGSGRRRLSAARSGNVMAVSPNACSRMTTSAARLRAGRQGLREDAVGRERGDGRTARSPRRCYASAR